MARNASAPSTALIAISVVHAGQRIDVAVPATVPVVELLPGLVRALGRLTADAASQGFRAILPSGRELDQALSLADQQVDAGAVLTLEVAGTAATDVRYDDLVEAIGASVDAGRTPWRRGDSVQLSAYSAVALFVVAAALLVLRGADSLVASAIMLAGAVLVALSAMVLVRMDVLGGAVALALTVPLLTGASAYALSPGPPDGVRVVAAGAGVLVGASASALLPSRVRAVAAAPVVVGLACVLVGALRAFAYTPLDRAAAMAVALVTVSVLLAPWIGLAQIPAHVDAVAATPRRQIDGGEVREQVDSADIAVLGIRIAAALATTALAPFVAVTPFGALLVACVGVAFLLGTRSLYGRGEVLTGVIGGLTTLVSGGLVATSALPESLPWLVGLAVGVGGVVLAWNVVSPGLRPWLTRLAGTLHVAALMAVLPLTALIWGIA